MSEPSITWKAALKASDAQLNEYIEKCKSLETKLAERDKELAAALVCIKDKDAALLRAQSSIEGGSNQVNEALWLTPSSDRLEAYVRERMGEPVAYRRKVKMPLGYGADTGYVTKWVYSTDATMARAPAIHRWEPLYALTFPAVSEGEKDK